MRWWYSRSSPTGKGLLRRTGREEEEEGDEEGSDMLDEEGCNGVSKSSKLRNVINNGK